MCWKDVKHNKSSHTCVILRALKGGNSRKVGLKSQLCIKGSLKPSLDDILIRNTTQLSCSKNKLTTLIILDKDLCDATWEKVAIITAYFEWNQTKTAVWSLPRPLSPSAAAALFTCQHRISQILDRSTSRTKYHEWSTWKSWNQKWIWYLPQNKKTAHLVPLQFWRRGRASATTTIRRLFLFIYLFSGPFIKRHVDSAAWGWRCRNTLRALLLYLERRMRVNTTSAHCAASFRGAGCVRVSVMKSVVSLCFSRGIIILPRQELISDLRLKKW